MFFFGARAAQDDESALHALGDFTANARLLLLSSVAILIGIISAYVAVGLLSLINFFTNLFFFHRFSIAAASPAAHMLGAFVVGIPVIGGLIIGFMARYGSERIRGHGIPEAIESILINGSRVEPKVALLKQRLAQLTGRQVTMTTKVDPSIIGGVVARIGSTVYDASVTRQLEKMKERLVESV